MNLLVYKFVIFNICLFTASSALSAQQCQNIFSKKDNSLLTPKDVQLFDKSVQGPAMNGYGKATSHYVEFGPGRTKQGDVILPWNVFFLRDESKPAPDWPSQVLSELPSVMKQVTARRMELLQPNYPLQIFYVTHAVKVSTYQHFKESWTPWQPLSNLKSGGLAFTENLFDTIRIQIGDSVREYRFTNQSQVVFISAGEGKRPSTWNDFRVLAHEIAHLSQFNPDIQFFRFYQEAHADFISHFYLPRSYLNRTVGSLRFDTSSAELKTLESAFSQFKTLNHHSFGGLLAHHFFKVWQTLKEHEKDYLLNSYFGRLERLLASPDGPFVNFERDYIRYKFKGTQTISSLEAQEIVNFIAGASMQWAIEAGLSRSAVLQIGEIWESMGAKGPYRRTRTLDRQDNGTIYFPEIEKHYEKFNIPVSWPSAEALYKWL